MTHPYKYILYSGGDTITVNENLKPEKHIAVSEHRQKIWDSRHEENLAFWHSSCKTIKIAEGEREKIIKFALKLWNERTGGYMDFPHFIDKGIQIPPELVRIESILIKQLPNLQQWQELAYFAEQKEEGEEWPSDDIILSEARKYSSDVNEQVDFTVGANWLRDYLKQNYSLIKKK